MSESTETKAHRLKMEIGQFSAEIQADQRNRKKTAAPTAETPDEQMRRIHNAKPAPPVRDTNPTMPVTRIRMNGQTVEDFGDHERTYGPAFVPSGGKEFNLKNHNDQHAFMQMYWPDCPAEKWPVVYNTLLLQGRVTRAGAEEFARKLKAGHAVVSAENLPHGRGEKAGG
jgi:hypothetical protein